MSSSTFSINSSLAPVGISFSFTALSSDLHKATNGDAKQSFNSTWRHSCQAESHHSPLPASNPMKSKPFPGAFSQARHVQIFVCDFYYCGSQLSEVFLVLTFCGDSLQLLRILHCILNGGIVGLRTRCNYCYG